MHVDVQIYTVFAAFRRPNSALEAPKAARTADSSRLGRDEDAKHDVK